MYDQEPTVRTRYVGQELLRAAQKTGRNSNDMAELLSWSPSKVSRLLSGKRGVSTEDVAGYLALCGVTGPARKELLALAAFGYESSWWQDHRTRPPIRFTALAENEAAALQITCFGHALVPDLMRAPDYARAVLIAQPNIPDDEIEQRLEGILRRQRILNRSFGLPTVQVFLSEYVLNCVGAGDVVMSDQAHHLLRLAVRPEITIRVVPENHETTIGMHGIGSFTLLKFNQHRPAVYLEHATSTVFLEEPETTTTYCGIVSQLDRIALSQYASRERIAEIAEQRASNAAELSVETTAIWTT